MKTTQYSLRELGELTGIEPRTIRWYISEGLLKAPEGRGRSAYYTERHLIRLEAIKRMKDYGLSLRDIRKFCQMAGEDEQIAVSFVPEICDSLLHDHSGRGQGQYRQVFRGEGALWDKSSPASVNRSAGSEPMSEPTDPAGYRERARRLRVELERQRLEKLAMRGEGLEPEARVASPLVRLMRLIEKHQGGRKAPRKARGEAQFVIDITPDIGLVLRGEYGREEQVLFEELADCLREWLAGGGWQEP